MKRLDNKISIHAAALHDLPSHEGNLKIHAFGGKGMGAIGKACGLRLELCGHLPGQHLNGPGAEHA